MRRRKKWVPDVLWVLFKSEARTLLETILHLIPPNCSCSLSKTKWNCLRCCFRGADPASYLLRPDDPPDYRILLNRSFVVVPPDAPPLLPDPTSDRRWSHRQIVRRTIETILAQRPGSANVICCGYDKLKDLGPNAKLLNSSAWDLVSQRVGERLMTYLLFHSSIFLPVPYGKYQQVAGSPVTALLPEFRRHISEPESSAEQGYKRKRRRGNRNSFSHSKKLACVPASQAEGLQSSSGVSDVSQTKKAVIFSGNDHINLECATEELRGNQGGLNLSISQENRSLCSCCSIFQTSLGVPKDAEIKRRPMLYNSESSQYLLPKKHILYSSKLSYGGSKYLIRKIFALPKANFRQPRIQCSHNEALQSHESACLYHSLMKLLKVVISRAQHCNNDKLLDKHCPVPIWPQNKRGDVSTVKGCRERTTFPAKRQLSNLPESNIQQKRSRTFESSYGSSKIKAADSQPCLNVCYKSRECERYQTSKSSNGSSEKQAFDSQPCLNTCYNSTAQVVSFVWAACRKIVPPALLGPPSSWRILRRNISRFIQMRRFEKSTLKQCMSDLKMSEFPAVSSKCYLCCSEGQIGRGNRQRAPSNLRHELFERWIFWFFSDIVAPIIQANFYVTESEHGKQELNFYRKSVWKKISDQAIDSLQKQGYSNVGSVDVRDMISNRPWGFSKLRFCPKEMGVRPIANLSAPSRIFKREPVTGQRWGMQRKVQSYPGNDQFGYSRSVNHILRDMHPVFRDLRTKKPEDWGASVFNYDDVYEKLCHFLMRVKKGKEAMPTPFIVVSDVNKAFDTVDQGKLFSILEEILMKDEYPLQKSNEIACRKKSLWGYENFRLMSEQCTEVKSSGPSRPWNTIVVDQGKIQNIRKEEIKYYLCELLKHNVLHIDQCFFRQNVGIPQGSVLSTLLCSLYLGHLERKCVFPLLKRECKFSESVQENDHVNGGVPDASQNIGSSGSIKYTLLRFIDDFLFISTSKELATSFLSELEKGFEEYNCNMNKDKFSLNFDMGHSPKIVPKSLVVGDDGVSFIQWSGLLINCHTLEVQADYTRYMNNHLSSTITISHEGKVGSELKQKLCDYMRPKCHPLFFDSNINSPSTVRLNVYQAFVLAAMKFHCYVRELSSFYKCLPVVYFKAIECSLRYMHKLIRKRMRTVGLRSDWKPILELAKEETLWLGRTAYIRVLTKKQSRYKDLLRILKSELVALGDFRRVRGLMYAVDDSHSSYMWKLKY